MIARKIKMVDREKQHPPEKPHRSVLVSDYSVRDIPFMLMAFIIISLASIVLGLFVESVSSFWRGYLWGIVTTILAMAVLRQVFRTKLDETK